MTTPVRKKLIEVALPLEAINSASAHEKMPGIGAHPRGVHLWWARRPLVACRAVLFSQMVDDPSSWPSRFPTEGEQEAERKRLHQVIKDMVPWEASTNEAVLDAARWEIARSVAWGLGEEPPMRGDSRAILNYLQAKAPPVYDPFSGGGSIPLEAQRLGLRAYGSDLNPVAVLIGKAVVEIPPKFAGRPPINPNSRTEAANGQLRAWKGPQGLAEDVRHYGQWMRNEAEKRIGHLYPKARLRDNVEATVIAWIWARTVRSPDPAAKGAMVPLVSSFMLSTKEGKRSWVEPVLDVEAQDGWRFEVRTGNLTKLEEERIKKGTKAGKGQAFVCVVTGSSIDRSYIQAEGKADRLGKRLMAVVADGNRNRAYVSPDHSQDYALSDELATEINDARAGFLSPPTPTRAMITGGVCSAYGLRSWGHLFTDRQLCALITLSRLIESVGEKVIADYPDDEPVSDDIRLYEGGLGRRAYADAIMTYLACALDRAVDFGNSITRWSPSNEKVMNLFARQAIPMVFDFTESNTMANVVGGFLPAVNFAADCLERTPATSSGSIGSIDAAANSFPVRPIVVSTDPPYYDNIGYADLSDFFYVWLKFSLTSVWPDLFRRLITPKERELVATAYRFPDGNIPNWVDEQPELASRWLKMSTRDRAETFFLNGMSNALKAIREAATDDEPITVYYAFKQSEIADEGITSAGWASFLQAIVDAGLGVVGTWPLRSEQSERLIGKGANALASSIVLVCRKRLDDAQTVTRADFIRALKREMPAAIDAIRKAGVGPVDMQQSVIGPGMGVFSRHAKVLEDDDSAMGVKTALAVINRVWEEMENELDQAFDPETQVALAWYATYGFEARASGELITLTTAKNTSDRALFESGVFKDLRGKAGLTPRDELPPGWSPASDKTLTTWECVQHTARVLNAADGGGEAAAALVAQMGPKAEEARALAYRLFEIATNKGWAAEALVYNELAQEWSKLEDRAATLDDAGRAPGPNQTTFAFDGSA
jgi:putative DNA methylase